MAVHLVEMKLDSLGLLKNLEIYDCFCFTSNGKCTYSVVSKKEDTVCYRMINRSQKSDPKGGIMWNTNNYKHFPKNHPMMIEYEIDGNVEVFDFLPF